MRYLLDAIVEVHELKKSFKNHLAVNNVSFTIAPGEVFGLLGPNGAGKTTIVRMLTTLLMPDSGQATICGYDVRRQAFLVRQQIGYVPQALSADGALTGYENLLIFAKLLGLNKEEREKRIAEMLNLMQLSDASDRLVRNYSGGMVRRLEISQAMLHYPPVLFLDEPTVGLDPVARRGVWEKLSELRHVHQIAILLTTHYMDEAEMVCNRVGILNHGEMVISGTPKGLKEKLGNPDASMDDVFAYFTGNQLDTGGSYREIRRVRRTSNRLG